jgi:multidrug resistance efflux pump
VHGVSKQWKQLSQTNKIPIKEINMAEHNAAAADTKPFLATKIMLIVIFVLFIWYLVADRITPYTASARFQAFVIPVAPEVSGYITEIPVARYTLVDTGDALLRIDPRKFELAVRSAEASLEVAGQEVGAGTAGVAAATAELTKAQVAVDEARLQSQRVYVLEERGVMSRAQGDQARAIVATAEAQLSQAEAELQRQKKALGTEGENNPRVQYALAQLEKAQLDRANTELHANTPGYIGSLYIDEGAYATAGQPVMTFIALNDFWIEAYMTENNLGRVKPGDKVEIAFDAYPGQIFHGKVKKTAPGVSTGKKKDLGELSTAKKTGSWLRSAQRFSVIIETTDYDISTERVSGLRHNSQVDVIIYTGDGFFWNTLGKLWIRVMSIMSYAY